jgi:archaellum biogenesis ATPase FlaH
MSPDIFETGIEQLDRELGGGIPAATVFVYKAASNSKSELFLEHVASQFNTVYITTHRSESFLEHSIQQSPIISEKPEIIDVSDSLDLTEEIESQLQRKSQKQAIIIDSIDVIESEQSGKDFRQWINSIKKIISKTDSIVIFHAYRTESLSENRNILLGMADLILELERETNGRDVETFFRISKFRGGKTTNDRLKVMLTDTIEVDTKRTIS